MTTPDSDQSLGRRRGFLPGLVLGALVTAGVVIGAAAGALAWLGVQEVDRSQLPEPQPSVVTAQVEQAQLSARVSAVASVSAGKSIRVPAPEIPSGRQPVVTATPLAQGQPVAEGDVVTEVALRPVIALQGRFTMFRPLSLGLRGPDVRFLQEGLTRLSYDVGKPDGKLDSQTVSALRAFYRDRGYQLWTTGETEDGPKVPDKDVLVPLGELIFIDQLPTTGEVTCAPTGKILEETSVCTLRTKAGTLKASVAATLAAEIEVGDPVTLQTDAGDVEGYTVASAPQPVTVPGDDQVEDGAGADAGSDNGEVMEFDLAAPQGAKELPAGQDFPVSVITEQSSEQALLVPVTALQDGPAGTSLQVVGGTRAGAVAVDVGLCVSGHCVVEPADPSALSEGDQVRVFGKGPDG